MRGADSLGLQSNAGAQLAIMNTIQKTFGGIVLLVVLALAFYQGHEASKLRQEMQAIRAEEHQRVAVLNEEVKSLERQRDKASNQVAEMTQQLAERPKGPAEVQKLRGEVGRLRRENADIGSSSPLSKVTSNPDSVKLLREQQKLGMGMIYQGLGKELKLTSDQTQKLNELLADHIMENVNHVTTALRDKPTSEQLNQVFATQEAALNDDVRNLLGDDGFTNTRIIRGSSSAKSAPTSSSRCSPAPTLPARTKRASSPKPSNRASTKRLPRRACQRITNRCPF